jgi:hypothetical protein
MTALPGFVIGAVAGALGGGLLGAGAGVGAGVGVATGLEAGACLTPEAAPAKGLLTAEREAGLLSAATRRLASAKLPGGSDTRAIDCAAVFADRRKGAP